MVNSGQSSKFWLTDPPLHRWFKARPTLFMQSSPLIFFASNLSMQEHRQERKQEIWAFIKHRHSEEKIKTKRDYVTNPVLTQFRRD